MEAVLVPLMDKWIKKMWYTYTLEYYSAIKNEIWPFVTTWIDLEDIMLGQISQTEKDKYHMIPLICGIKEIKKQTHRHLRTDWWLPEVRGREWVRQVRWVKRIKRYK